MSTSTSKDQKPPRSFARFLSTYEDGDFEREVSAAMKQLTADLLKRSKHKHTKSKGSLSIKVDFLVKPEGTVEIVPTFTSKAPPSSARGSMMWLTDEGDLAEDNPKQTKLALRGVDGGAKREPQMEKTEAGE